MKGLKLEQYVMYKIRIQKLKLLWTKSKLLQTLKV